MINIIWFVMIAFGFIYGIITGNVSEVTDALIENAETGVEISLGLIGVMALWLGLVRIAEESGLIQKLANALKPVTSKLFPSVKDNAEAMGSVLMTIAVEFIGSPNAATPLGLSTMNEFQKVNKHKDVASDAMVMFVAIACSSLTLVPITVMAMLSSAGGSDTTNIIGPILISTTVSTVAAITSVKLLGKLPRFQIENQTTEDTGSEKEDK